jgi:hypothetical protein
MSLARLDIDLPWAQNALESHLLLNSGARRVKDNLGALLSALASGAVDQNSVKLVTGAVKASGTITFSSLVADDTVTINGVVFTAKASPSGANQFALGADDTAAAANLAAKINASALAKIANVVTATSNGAVVTITCVVPGLVGNLGTLAISAHGSVSGAALTGGAEATITTL